VWEFKSNHPENLEPAATLESRGSAGIREQFTLEVRLKRVMRYRAFVSAFVFLLAAAVHSHAAGKASEPDLGPTFSGTVRAKYPGTNETMKGVVVTLDKASNTYICYDTDLMRVSLGWTGGFLKFGNYQKEIVHPQPPEVAGTPIFGSRPGPGWSRDGKFDDRRPNAQGPLSREHAKHRGL